MPFDVAQLRQFHSPILITILPPSITGSSRAAAATQDSDPRSHSSTATGSQLCLVSLQASQMIVAYDEHEVNNTFKFGVIYQKFRQVSERCEHGALLCPALHCGWPCR